MKRFLVVLAAAAIFYPLPTISTVQGDINSDGRIDLADPGCADSADDNEWNRGRR